ncbi:hypothetical protein [Aliiroseovarius sp.]|uniref:hypothetical protein n=1 Tax=Aliiroseovarius sp. TaxID=1872442 RepID=UPI003BAD08DC
MPKDRPSYCKRGEHARLFPVLSTTSKEGRTTSIVLACLERVKELREVLLGSLGQRLGARARLDCFTEVAFEDTGPDDRPDGLIVLHVGRREWTLLVEAKVGAAPLKPEQVEKYRQIARAHGLDGVLTISNQFTVDPVHHPLEEVRKSRSKVQVYHWSWTYILTVADLLLSSERVEDADQLLLLEELHRFLSHESAGVKGFERMPPEWGELNKLVSAGGAIPARSEEARAVIEAWHQETRDLSLILSRQTETHVGQRLMRRHRDDPAQRMKDELAQLRERKCLFAHFNIPDAAAPLEVTADLGRRCVDVGMTLRAPEDRKSSKARLNWLLRQVKADAEDLHIRMNWPGSAQPTIYALADLRADPGLIDKDRSHLVVNSFHVFIARRLGARFTQLANFITDLEAVVPEFYREVGQDLQEWRKPAPRIKAGPEVEPEPEEG